MDFLNSKVRVSQVNLIKSREEFSLNESARLENNNSELTYFPFTNPMYAITVVSFLTDDGCVIRGNHFHKLKDEYIYILNGKFKGKYVDLETKENITIDLIKGDLVHVSPNCAHVYLAEENSSFLEFTPTNLTSWDSYPFTVASSYTDF